VLHAIDDDAGVPGALLRGVIRKPWDKNSCRSAENTPKD